LDVLIAQPACPLSLVSYLSVLEESPLSVLDVYGYSEARAVSDEPRCGSRMHTRGHGGFEVPNRSPDSILSNEPKSLGKHRPPPLPSKPSLGESSYPL
ncbi:hypothetical protein Tco_1511569, partial [Tanacetum coccineum]